MTHLFEGVFLTKVIYLEHPDRAVPAGTRPGQLIERTLNPGEDLLEEARQYGRPMLVLRVGERPADPAEMLAQAIPGTILYPTEKTLMPPRVPPQVPFACASLIDPVLGPRPPEEECLHDGGDGGRRAGIGPGGRLEGLDPSDTVVEYTDSSGRRRVMPSNRVCICVPRFAALRSELPLAGLGTSVAVGNAEEAARQVQIGLRLPSTEACNYEQLNALRVKRRPSQAASETGVEPIPDAGCPGCRPRVPRSRPGPGDGGRRPVDRGGSAATGEADGVRARASASRTATGTAAADGWPRGGRSCRGTGPVHRPRWRPPTSRRFAASRRRCWSISRCTFQVGGSTIGPGRRRGHLLPQIQQQRRQAHRGRGRQRQPDGTAGVRRRAVPKTDRNAVFTMQQNEAGSVDPALGSQRQAAAGTDRAHQFPGAGAVSELSFRACMPGRERETINQPGLFPFPSLDSARLLITLTLSDIGDEYAGGV